MLLLLASCASLINSKSTPNVTTNAAASTAVAVGVKVDDAGWTGFCLNAKPIPWNINDPDAEILAIKSHNAKGVAHCGW